MDSPSFEFFLPYEVNSKKLLDHQFELSAWPGPQDEDGHLTHAQVKLSGHDLLALARNGPPPPEDEGPPMGNGIKVGSCTYQFPKEADESAFALLTTLLNGMQSADEGDRTLCEAALFGHAVFYLLHHEQKLDEASPSYHSHYFMLAVFRGEGHTGRKAKEFRFWYAGLIVPRLEEAFDMDSKASFDSPWVLAGAARDLGAFLRTSPFWTAMFADRARRNTEFSRRLVLCLPEAPSIAGIDLAHTLEAHHATVREFVSALATERRNATAQVLRGSKRLLFVALVAIVLFLMTR